MIPFSLHFAIKYNDYYLTSDIWRATPLQIPHYWYLLHWHFATKLSSGRNSGISPKLGTICIDVHFLTFWPWKLHSKQFYAHALIRWPILTPPPSNDLFSRHVRDENKMHSKRDKSVVSSCGRSRFEQCEHFKAWAFQDIARMFRVSLRTIRSICVLVIKDYENPHVGTFGALPQKSGWNPSATQRMSHKLSRNSNWLMSKAPVYRWCMTDSSYLNKMMMIW